MRDFAFNNYKLLEYTLINNDKPIVLNFKEVVIGEEIHRYQG